MPRISYRNKLLLKKILRVALIALAIALVVSIVVLIYVEPYIVYDREGAHLNLKVSESDCPPNSDAKFASPTQVNSEAGGICCWS